MKSSKKSKGSIAVFLAIIFGVTAGMSVLMANLAKENAENGKNFAKIGLSTRAVLSEYERSLKDEYGIFAVDLNCEEIKSRISMYLDMNKVKESGIAVSTGEMSLNNSQTFQNEIVEYSLFLLGKDLLKRDKEYVTRQDNRVLRNEKTIGELPSKGIKNEGIYTGTFGKDMEKVDGFFDRTKKKVLVNEYILRSFNNHVEDEGDTFFKNEVEYILAGQFSDKENQEAVERKLKVVRNLANLAYIETSTEMKAAILAAAAATGLAAEVAVPLITETWALAEANNDVKILLKGGKVPIVKDQKTWATDIDSLGNVTSEGFIDTKSETGMDYGDYLQVLLYLQNNETKLKRTMDLIQINIQGKYNRNFLISNGTTGFAYSIKVGNDIFEGKEKY